MLRAILSLCAVAASTLAPVAVDAQGTSSETPIVDESPQPTTTPSPSVTPSPAGTATRAPSGREPTFTISGQLIVDQNGNGIADAGEEEGFTPTLVQLVSWPRLPDAATSPLFAAAVVDLLTDEQGGFSFMEVPPGTYSLYVWWAGGFAAGATERLPDLHRAIITVSPNGLLARPTAIPATWPESFGAETIDVQRDNVSVGFIPQPLLLKPKPEGVVPFPVGTGLLIEASGTVNVGEKFAEFDRNESPSVQLPDTGDGGGQDSRLVVTLPLLFIALLLGSVLILTTLRQRQHREC